MSYVVLALLKNHKLRRIVDHSQQPRHPENCFCHIPIKDLQPWVNKRYEQELPTMELLKSAKTSYDKEIVSIVAMLDVSERTLLEMMDQVEKSNEHIIHCRHKIKKILKLED